MGRAFSAFSGAPWGQAAPSAAVKRGNLTVGVSLGSGYQHYFAALSADRQNAETAKMKAAGITWVRIDVDWSDAQASAGAGYDFSKAQAAAGPLLAAGLNVLAILLWAPSWALAVGNNPAVSQGTAADPFATISPEQYADFCGNAAQTLGALGISAFELWNEPNLDSGDPGRTLGLGHLSPIGYAALATAAYERIHTMYVPKAGGAPTPTVIGGVMSGWPRLDWSPTPRAGASWPAVPAGATSATVSCAAAVAGLPWAGGDQYQLVTGSAVSLSTSATDTGGQWPAGTYISSVTQGQGYVLSPPPWTTQFPSVDASSSGTTFGLGTGYPPDVFLTQLYAASGGKPMFDAVSCHPYAWPGLGAFRYADSGSWAMVPALRQIMLANGDGAKAIWFTEIGAPTGQVFGSWPSAAATATQLVIDGEDAKAEDLGYLVGAPGLPMGSYVAAVNPGVSWTVLPPTGVTLGQALTAGATVTSLVLTSHNAAAVTIPANATLTVWLGNGNGGDGAGFNGYGEAPFLTVQTTAAVTIPAGGNGTVGTTSATVPAFPSTYTGFEPTSAEPATVQFDRGIGRTWASAVPATTRAVLNLVAPGVATTWSVVPASQAPSAISSEDQQALVIAAAYEFVTSAPWPYVGPMFVYCWSDASVGNNAGPYGLTRVDGSAKPSVAALAAVAQTGGASPGIGLPGYAG
jgi:hypothetical protein